MYAKLVIPIENKVYLKSMIFGEISNLKAYVWLTHGSFMCHSSAWIHNLEIHQKKLSSYVIYILLLKFCYIFKFLVGF
jgi:hypothetical protein